MANVVATAYTHAIVGFYLPSLNRTTDFAAIVTNPDPIYNGRFFVDQMHKAGKKVLMSVGGATELPINANYFTLNDPIVCLIC